MCTVQEACNRQAFIRTGYSKKKIQIDKLPRTLHWPTPSEQAHSHKHKNHIVSTDVKTDFSV